MFATTSGTHVPARKLLLAFVAVLMASTSIAARADDGMVDVRTLPQVEGATPNQSAHESYPEIHLSYRVPTVVAITTAATRKLLAANGWQEFVYPNPSGHPMSFKKGQQGLTLSFSQGLGRPDQSVVYYSADRLYNNVPFPQDATDIVFDDRRPYLSCLTAATIEASLDLFRQGLLAAGWTALSAADIAARWPNAKPDETIANGSTAYFSRDVRDGGPKQPPIMLSLLRRDDGKTSVEVKVAPFMQPQNLELAKDVIGLPMPDHTDGFGSTGSSDSIRRKVEGRVRADLPVVMAFFRRELAAQNWKEETSDAGATINDVTLNFSSPDQNARLRLVHKYNLTFVTLIAQMKESALAARARAKKEADDNFFKNAEAAAKQIIAADETRRVAQAANLSDAPLHALADNTRPVPLPENADNIKFDGGNGQLEFDSGSSVKAIAAFYRGVLKSQGWKEQPDGINKSNMVMMDFSRAGKALSFTAMQMGPRAKVSADGSGLMMASAKMAGKPAAAGAQASNETTVRAADQVLDAEPDSALPVPKQHTMSSIGTGKVPGSNAPIRRELEASIPAELDNVLGFYRTELGKLGWKETVEGAVVKPDQVQLAFTSADGPATLKLGRSNGETSVNLAQKYPAVAAKADVVPKPGQAKLIFGNLGGGEATVSINKQTIRIASGAGGPQSPKPPMLDLPPGKYPYTIKVAGGPARSSQIEIAADDTWGLMVAPNGEVLPLHMY
ncbi:MAG: hypothetical protein ABJA75_24900 [Bradyrhizobium sp.]